MSQPAPGSAIAAAICREFRVDAVKRRLVTARPMAIKR
jgi:hypothetical protein